MESELLNHIQRFLMELGTGFAFVGRQVHLEVESKDYYLDLLFYHLKLRCFVVVALKSGPFKPEFAGKMNFYLSAVDDLQSDLGVFRPGLAENWTEFPRAGVLYISLNSKHLRSW